MRYECQDVCFVSDTYIKRKRTQAGEDSGNLDRLFSPLVSLLTKPQSF